MSLVYHYRCPECEATWSGPSSRCPECGCEEIVETETCEICGQEADAYKVFSGVCTDCIDEKLDYETGLKYLIDRGELKEFLCYFTMRPELDGKELFYTFLKCEVADQKFGKRTFLDALKDYICSDSFCTQDFAEWLIN